MGFEPLAVMIIGDLKCWYGLVLVSAITTKSNAEGGLGSLMKDMFLFSGLPFVNLKWFEAHFMFYLTWFYDTTCTDALALAMRSLFWKLPFVKRNGCSQCG